MTTTTTAPSSRTEAPHARRSINNAPPWVGGSIGVLIMLVIWWIASKTLYQASHSIPDPFTVFAFFFRGDEWSSLWRNASPTVGAAARGFLWGNLIALLMAFMVLLLPPVEEVVTQIAIVTYCLPTVAIGPIVVIVAGQDSPQGAPITLAALAVFFTTVVGSLLGLRAAPQASLDLITAYGGSRMAQLRKVQLIAALPSVFASLKVAAPGAFLGAVLAEYLGGGGGNSFGKALIGAQTQSDSARLWYLALVSGAIAGLGYFLIGLIARLVTPWTTGSDSRAGHQ